MIGTTLSHFRILKKLGSGGMGDVYLAEDLELERQVAVKVLPPASQADPESIRRFCNEAKAASALNHPNIATIYEIGESGTTRFIVMEYLAGKTLAEVASARLSIAEVLDIAIQTVDALDAAHSRGILHRDLKPTNIMRSDRGQIKVLDFGLAKILLGPSVNDMPTADTTPGMILGTVQYMSPEQALGRPIDFRSDIFSLGVVLYELVTGKRPFEGNTVTETVDRIRNSQPEAIARLNYNVPPELERIIRKCIEKDPDNRYQSARELHVDLRNLKRDSSLAFAVAAPVPPSRRPNIVIVAAVLVAVIAAAWMMRNRQPAAPKSDVSGVVVLPAKVFGAPELSYLTDAVPGTLSTLLAQVPYLETKLPPSSVEVDLYKGNIQRIAEMYGVQTTIIPTITAQSDNLVLNIDVVDPSSRKVLWSRQYKGKRDNYNEMLRTAADAAGQALRPNQVPLGTTTRGLAANSTAELAYRQGQHFFDRYNYQHQQADFTNALDAFQRAFTADPKLANAAAKAGWLYVFRLEDGSIASAEAFAEIDRWAQQALGVDAQCGLAISLQVASLWWSDAEMTQTLPLALKAAVASPNEAFAVGALPAVLSASLALQNAAFAEQARLDPLYLYPPLDIAQNLLLMGRTDEGLPFVDNVIRLDPNLTGAVAGKAILLAALDRTDEAKKLLTSIPDSSVSSRSHRYLWFSAKSAVALASHDADTERAARNELEHLHQASPNHWDLPMDLWMVPFFMKYGRRERAYDALNEAILKKHPPAYDWLMTDPELAGVREEKRFKPILDRSRKEFMDMLAILNDAEARGELPRFLQRPLAELRTQY